jgi:hypothetical protein
MAAVIKDDKYGYIDSKGNLAISISYEADNGVYSASEFHEGLASIEKKGKIGFIDKQGNEVIPCIYDIAGYFSDGLAVVKKNGKYGLIDSLGNEILPPAYLQVRKISNSGLAIVVLDTIINHNAEKRNTWSLLLQPHDTLKVKYSYVNHEGKFQFPEPFVGCELIGDLNAEDLLNEFCINHTFKCGLALITDSISLLNGYINISGDTVIPISYVKASYFSEDIAPVLTKVETDSASHSVVENTGKYGFIDKAGNKVSDFKLTLL